MYLKSRTAAIAYALQASGLSTVDPEALDQATTRARRAIPGLNAARNVSAMGVAPGSLVWTFDRDCIGELRALVAELRAAATPPVAPRVTRSHPVSVASD